jgi:hypothetical protein
MISIIVAAVRTSQKTVFFDLISSSISIVSSTSSDFSLEFLSSLSLNHKFKSSGETKYWTLHKTYLIKPISKYDRIKLLGVNIFLSFLPCLDRPCGLVT